MNKKRIVVIGLIILMIGITLFLLDRSRIVTFEEFVDEFMDEDEHIIKMEVRNSSYIQNQTYVAMIEDQQVMNRILTTPDMRLKKRLTTDPPVVDYENTNELYIYTDKDTYHLYFDSTEIHMDENEYNVLREGKFMPYHLFSAIKFEDLEWIKTENDT